MSKTYRLKHVPTGLYWVKKSYSLSDIGSLFTTASSFNGLEPDEKVPLFVPSDKFIRQHLDIFERVGELKEIPETKWDMKTLKIVPTSKLHFEWSMMSKVSDFEKEYVSLDPKAPESSVDNNQKLIEKIADICWNHRVNPDIETFDEWLNLIQDELKQR